MAQGFCVQLPLRIFTNAGLPGNGYLVYTYATNSTTPKATYSDGQLSSLNANPVECDAYGFCRIFIAQGETIKLAVHDADDVLQYTFDYQQPMISSTAGATTGSLEIGMSMDWPDPANPPTGWLVEDGSAVSRVTYATLSALYAAMSSPYPFGNGNGTTTFNLRDTRGRFPLYKAASGTGSTIGATGGALDHVHTGPSHTHTTVVPYTGWNGTQIAGPGTDGVMMANDGIAQNPTQATQTQTVTSSASGTGNTGGSNPAYIVVGCSIVKAL